MTEVLDRPRTQPGGWAAVVAGNGVLGVVGAVAVVLWWATAEGLAQRWGWMRPDPTMFRDGLTPWVLLAVVATAVDLALVLGLNAVVRRLLPVGPARLRRLIAVGTHLVVAVGLAAAYLGGAWS